MSRNEVEFLRGSTFVAPQVLVDVNHCKWRFFGQATPLQASPLAMDVMMVGPTGISAPVKLKSSGQEETFGPVIGIQKVGEPPRLRLQLV